WFAVLFVDTGIYRGAVIRFTVQIPFDYPNCGPPDVFFEPIVFHPLINPKNGALITKYTFPDWICHERRICELFLFVKAMFTDLEIVLKEQLIEEDSCDSVAVFYATNFNLFKNDFSEFKRRVNESLDECRNKLYEIHSDDKNGINFGPWSPEIHEELRKKLISGQNITEVDEPNEHRGDCRSGLSWVQKGSSQMFSKFNC
ncbi:AKT-interacting protein-like protein, partial [Leptotrombidium deliense]